MNYILFISVPLSHSTKTYLNEQLVHTSPCDNLKQRLIIIINSMSFRFLIFVVRPYVLIFHINSCCVSRLKSCATLVVWRYVSDCVLCVCVWRSVSRVMFWLAQRVFCNCDNVFLLVQPNNAGSRRIKINLFCAHKIDTNKQTNNCIPTILIHEKVQEFYNKHSHTLRHSLKHTGN